MTHLAIIFIQYTKKTTYLDKYGGSAVITALLLFTFFIIFSYYFIQGNIVPIQQDWVNQRCKPNIMPFAGIINAPPWNFQIRLHQ